MKHARTDSNYAILTKRVKLQHEKKTVSNVLSMQSIRFEQKFMKLIFIRSTRIISLQEKNP